MSARVRARLSMMRVMMRVAQAVLRYARVDVMAHVCRRVSSAVRALPSVILCLRYILPAPCFFFFLLCLFFAMLFRAYAPLYG